MLRGCVVLRGCRQLSALGGKQEQRLALACLESLFCWDKVHSEGCT